MARTNKLSKTQQSILDYIASYIQEHTRPPTIREIGEAVGISSTSVVTYNLNKLEEKEWIIREREVSRGLRLSERAQNLYEAVSDAIENLIKIQIKGQIRAGEPINPGNDTFGTFDEEDVVEIAASMLPKQSRDLFALRVKGDSMIDAMVNEGDLVIMRQQEIARNGDMVAVWLYSSEATTLKHFYHEGDRIRLQPANPTMDPIYVDPEDVKVQGKVVMVVRQTP
jgi:repressor LexA